MYSGPRITRPFALATHLPRNSQQFTVAKSFRTSPRSREVVYCTNLAKYGQEELSRRGRSCEMVLHMLCGEILMDVDINKQAIYGAHRRRWPYQCTGNLATITTSVWRGSLTLRPLSFVISRSTSRGQPIEGKSAIDQRGVGETLIKYTMS